MSTVQNIHITEILQLLLLVTNHSRNHYSKEIPFLSHPSSYKITVSDTNSKDSHSTDVMGSADYGHNYDNNSMPTQKQNSFGIVCSPPKEQI